MKKEVALPRRTNGEHDKDNTRKDGEYVRGLVFNCPLVCRLYISTEELKLKIETFRFQYDYEYEKDYEVNHYLDKEPVSFWRENERVIVILRRVFRRTSQ